MSDTDYKKDGKILWLSIIQGWAILLVVIGHVCPYTYSGVNEELFPVGDFIRRLCYSFHMPLFMFVSGGLLYLTRLDRGYSTVKLYKDKFQRLVLPFLFFTVVGFAIRIPFAASTKRSIDLSIGGLFNAFWDPNNGPLVELWFLGTLIWLMVFYPLYVVAFKNKWSEIALLAVTAVPIVIGLKRFGFDGWLNLSYVPGYAFYFVGGMLFFKYRGVAYLESRPWLTVLMTAVFVSLFLFLPLGAPLAILGILCSFGWVGIVVHRFPNLFSSFRDYSFQIYLVGLFPQMFLELFIWKHYHAEWLVLPFYITSSVAAIYAGWLVGKVVSRIRCPQIRWLFGLK